MIDIFFYKSKKYLTFIDKFSKYTLCKELKSCNAIDICNVLIEVFSVLGTPKLIIADGEKGISSLTTQELAILAYNNTIHSTTKYTPYEIHFGTKVPFEFKPSEQLIVNEYVLKHKELMTQVYEEVIKNIDEIKNQIQNRNKSKEIRMPQIGRNIFIRNAQNIFKPHRR